MQRRTRLGNTSVMLLLSGRDLALHLARVSPSPFSNEPSATHSVLL